MNGEGEKWRRRRAERVSFYSRNKQEKEIMSANSDSRAEMGILTHLEAIHSLSLASSNQLLNSCWMSIGVIHCPRGPMQEGLKPIGNLDHIPPLLRASELQCQYRTTQAPTPNRNPSLSHPRSGMLQKTRNSEGGGEAENETIDLSTKVSPAIGPRQS